MAFVDDLHGWAVGEYSGYGVILGTLDGGNTWNVQHEDTTEAWNRVFALDEQTAWVAGYRGGVLQTTNGGATWEVYALPAGFDDCGQKRFGFATPLHGWLMCHNRPHPETDVCAETTDGGLTWNGTDLRVFEMDFADSLHGLAMGTEGMYYTTDGGGHWLTVDYPVYRDRLYGFDLVTSTGGWVVGRNGIVLHFDGAAVPVMEKPKLGIPLSFSITAYPNPFNPVTAIAFDLPRAGHVRLAVYDVTGRLVAQLYDEVQMAGSHQIQ
ncbi:MAG: hypothetical protein EHM35_09915, partial [Planctomycetaceae bacterium]